MGQSSFASSLHERVREYYTDKFRQFGATPRGADWRDSESQELRFARLLDVFEDRSAMSLIELGCGYGALCSYLRRAGWNVEYTGYDLAEEMVTAARQALHGEQRVHFEIGSRPETTADYCVASGIFNVRFDIDDADWTEYVFETLDIMASSSRRGFAFNFLTRFSDRDRMEARLFYADPGEMLDRCIERFGRRVSLAHGYGLFEFTMLVWHGAGSQR